MPEANNTYLHTYLLTPRCRVLLEKLTGLQLIKKFPAFHGTRRFITALTSVRHMSLSWDGPIQSTYPHPTSWRCILILSTHLRLDLPSGIFPPVSPPRTYTPPSPHSYVPHAQPISFFSILSPAQYCVSSTDHLTPHYAICSTHTHTHTHTLRKCNIYCFSTVKMIESASLLRYTYIVSLIVSKFELTSVGILRS